ncbi:protease modulator HflC [Gimibacter soli]|uniref:Protein HflC n=1 Tax=Gimibacter soli TaxID=3024400 RepID=A0AAF0BGJ3_9PROT|nr:protease modulator HflC [Gimibacter soli]WCL53563.1 protease modulator HflC [Gimibacter soli]
MNAKAISGIVVLVLGALLVGASLYTVNERQQAIVVQFGDPQRTVVEPGLHFKTPFVEQVIYLDKRILSLDVRPQEVLASDQRRLVVDSFARFRIADPLKTYQAARTETNASDLLEKIMQSSIRQVLANERMTAIVSGSRSELMKRISELTNERAASLGLEVLEVRLKRVDLPAANSQSIFQRMETERQREAAEKRAEGQEQALAIRAIADRKVAETLAEARREAAVIRGEADAEATRIFADAYGQDPEFFEFYRTLSAYRATLGKSDTRLVLSPDSEFFHLFLDPNGNGKRRK